jgi:hypothetical protein
MGNSHTLTRRASRGQAAMEFVLALFWIVALAAVLFQALHFELDVFNKMGELRYKVFHTARQDQDTTSGRMINDSIQGKNLGDLVGYTIPAQEIDDSLHYGPKEFSVFCGSKKWFPGGDGAETALDVVIGLGLAADHMEDYSGFAGTAFDALSTALGAVGSFCS